MKRISRKPRHVTHSTHWSYQRSLKSGKRANFFQLTSQLEKNSWVQEMLSLESFTLSIRMVQTLDALLVKSIIFGADSKSNIPRGEAVKRTLVADEGYRLSECDLEQAESRDTARCRR